MIAIESHEAILFRMLVAFFGQDRVIPQMSLMAVCGGSLPEGLNGTFSEQIKAHTSSSARQWAKRSKCLFTIVNEQDDPRMVIEFVVDFSDTIDSDEVTKRRFIRPVLLAAGIPYVTISQEEFSDITRPESGVDFCAFLESKFEDARP